jgi:hypothetical protein
MAARTSKGAVTGAARFGGKDARAGLRDDRLSRRLRLCFRKMGQRRAEDAQRSKAKGGKPRRRRQAEQHPPDGPSHNRRLHGPNQPRQYRQHSRPPLPPRAGRQQRPLPLMERHVFHRVIGHAALKLAF